MSDNYMNYSNAEEIFGGYAQSINKIKPTPITYAAYQALSAEEKAAKRYMITDYPSQNDSYNDLTNKPQINSVTLAGNKSAHDLGLVAEEVGKGLSSNDYTTAEKTKLAGLENYDDTQLAGRVSAIEGVIPNDATTLNKLATADDIPDTTNFIEKSVTTGLVKNDGTIDTHTYVQSSDLGTAAAKDYTDRVSPNNRGLVESQSVYSAIQSAVSSIYTPRGDLTCAELTSALLVAANVGDVYEMTDAGTTTALFLQGAGETIAVGANVGIINAGEGRILFNLMPGAFDLTDYQKKELDDPLTIGGVSRTEVEPALGALNTAKADKSEMSVTAGTGADADKTIIQLKSGTTATVLHAHQDISGKVDKSNTAGLLKNDGTVDINTYMTASDIAGKADKSEMSIVDGSGASADKTTITLKTGTSATVLKEHQDISGKAEKSEMSVTPGTGANADKTTIQLKEGTSATVLTQHQSLDAKADKILVATNNNLVAMDANGNIKDSGKSASDFASQDEVDDIVNVLGAKNLLPVNFDHMRKINGGGTWTNNVYTYNGITYTTNSDGTFTVNGTATEYSLFRIIDTNSIFLNPSSDYYITGSPSSSTASTYYVYYSELINGSWIYYSNLGNEDTLFTPNASATQFVVDIVVRNGQTASNVVFKPMIRLASDPDSTYVPYAMTNQQMTPYVQAISNPNLLDNAWFTVNQRGLSSYPHTSGKQYTLDRWFENAHASVTVTSSGITITSDETGNNSDLGQNTEGLYDLVVGKMITASVMLSNGKIYHGSGIIPSVYTVGAIRFDLENGYKCDININPDNANYALQFFMYSGASNPNASISVRACKLELGSVSTLAMDTRPNYQQELAKCQRFFIRLRTFDSSTAFACIGQAIVRSTTKARIFVPLPTMLRTKPSVTANIATAGGIKILTASEDISVDVTAIAFDNWAVNGIELNATTASQTTIAVGVACEAWIHNSANSYIDLSADL